MRSFKRWLAQKSRVRYWKRRALKAESMLDDALLNGAEKVNQLHDALEAERWRNMSREDTFVSATVMGSRNMFGVPPRIGPAIKQAGASSTLQSLDPWEQLSWADKQEFDQFWKRDAEAAGIPIPQARAQFMQELANRRAINDEPIG